MTAPEVYETRKLPPANPKIPKGKRTWQWILPDGRQITVYKRLDGEIAGKHFHKGKDLSKNPELFLLVSGIIEFEFVDKKGAHFTEEVSAENGPIELIIHPWILHRATPLTDCVFIEYRKTTFDPDEPDTFDAKHFPVKTGWNK